MLFNLVSSNFKKTLKPSYNLLILHCVEIITKFQFQFQFWLYKFQIILFIIY